MAGVGRAMLGLYLRVMIWVFVFSFLAQVFLSRATATASVWGFAPGWQREIGFFDLAFALIAFSAINDDNLRFQRSVTLVIVVLTTLVGSNHLATILAGRTSSLHEVFVGVNYFAVAFGCAALFSPADPGCSKKKGRG